MNKFVISNTVEGKKLEMKMLAELQCVIFVIGATLETMLVDDFDFVVNTKFSEFLAHESGVFIGGTVYGCWDCRNKGLCEYEVFWAEFDIKEICSCMSDGVAILAK